MPMDRIHGVHSPSVPAPKPAPAPQQTTATLRRALVYAWLRLAGCVLSLLSFGWLGLTRDLLAFLDGVGCMAVGVLIVLAILRVEDAKDILYIHKLNACEDGEQSE